MAKSGQEWWIGRGALGLAVLTLAAGIGYWRWTAGVYVEITNSTGGPLTQVGITYTGGVVGIPELKPNASFGLLINPKGESHLELAWTDAGGQKRSEKLDLYFDRNHRGRVDITVRPDGTISWTDRISIWPSRY